MPWQQFRAYTAIFTFIKAPLILPAIFDIALIVVCFCSVPPQTLAMLGLRDTLLLRTEETGESLVSAVMVEALLPKRKVGRVFWMSSTLTSDGAYLLCFMRSSSLQGPHWGIGDMLYTSSWKWRRKVTKRSRKVTKGLFSQNLYCYFTWSFLASFHKYLISTQFLFTLIPGLTVQHSFLAS